MPIFLLLFIYLPFFGITSEPTFKTDSDIQVVFNLDRKTEGEFWAHIDLKNSSIHPISHWKLGFTFQRILDSITGAEIVEQIGDYYLVKSDTNASIAPGGFVSFKFHGKYTIRNNEDLPTGYFILYTDGEGKEIGPLSVESSGMLLPYKPKGKTPGLNDYELNIQHNEVYIEGNPLDPVLAVTDSLIVPLPSELAITQGVFNLNSKTVILVHDLNVLKIAEDLGKSLDLLSGYHLEVHLMGDVDLPDNSILFTPSANDSELGLEGYLLDVTSKQITIQASDLAGYFYALQSLKQLFPPEIWSSKGAVVTKIEVPCLKIKDYPRFAYRGVLLDSVRHFFSVDDVKRFLDLMAMHKLNTFHWHLTDDEGWRIQINKYPELTDVGAWRGYGLPIPPALGSGINRYGGFYTQDEIRSIVQYAKDRYITIIPEIDLPAHSRALIMSLPNKLKESDDKTVYSSVRGFHDNVLSPCLESTYEVIDNILNEIIPLFPGSYIHIGGDERPKDVWRDSPTCKTMMSKNGLKNTNELQNYFIKRIQGILSKKNKSMGIWEEGLEGGGIDKVPKPLVYAWLNTKSGLRIADEGYDVVLSPSESLYLELAYDATPLEPGDYWGGYVDTFTVYNFRPIPSGIPKEVSARIKGVEGTLWSEFIRTSEELDYFAFPKLAALAEVAWTPKSRRSWRNFSKRMGKLHLARLDQYGVLYRISPPGVRMVSYQLHANDEFTGLPLHYTLDGSEPTSSSKVYSKPFKISSGLIRIGAFNSLGRSSKIVDLQVGETSDSPINLKAGLSTK